MVKERETIRVNPVRNVVDLVRRVFYRSPSRFVDPALMLIELLIREGGCTQYDIDHICRILCRRESDIEYVIRRLLQVKMLKKIDNMLCLSDEFCRILESMIQVWKSIIEHAEKSRTERILSKETSK
ncbi:MAG: hypothetical protein GXO10_03560 [Crenarchaeota archaeon]|nr:hypothetical protein [Thermoproteota archaeon]